MIFAENVRVGQYDILIVPLHTQKVMPIRFKCFAGAVRFVRMLVDIIE